MATNISITTGEVPITVYYRDGTTKTVEANSTATLELIDDWFITITDINVAERAKEFVQKMIAFWQGLFDKVPPMPSRSPEVTPQKKK